MDCKFFTDIKVAERTVLPQIWDKPATQRKVSSLQRKNGLSVHITFSLFSSRSPSAKDLLFNLILAVRFWSFYKLLKTACPLTLKTYHFFWARETINVSPISRFNLEKSCHVGAIFEVEKARVSRGARWRRKKLMCEVTLECSWKMSRFLEPFLGRCANETTMTGNLKDGAY